MQTELLQTYFSECLYFFFKYFTSSAIERQQTIKIKTEGPIFENENGMFLLLY